MKLTDKRFWKFELMTLLCGFLLLCQVVIVLICNGAEFESCNGAVLILLYDWNPVTANMRPENIPVNEGKYITDNELVSLICTGWAVLLIIPVLITSHFTKRWIVNKENTQVI